MKKIAHTFVCCLSVLTLVTTTTLSQGITRTTPSSVGLSEDRLAELTSLMQEHVDHKKLSGAVAVVARRGKVAYLQCVVKQDIEADIDMNAGTIFRIASMTKPITSAAVMMLYDEGLVGLDDPVSKYIPEFADATVLAPEGQEPASVPAKRPITIKHLLTHTSGLSYDYNTRHGRMYKDAGITNGIMVDDGILSEKMKKLARIPLLHQPGEAWTYGLSVDVLGRVVEVASGKTLEEFFEQRIFEPLGMKDTHFFIPAAKMARLAVVYTPKPEGGLKRLGSSDMRSHNPDHPYAGKRRYFSGGGGLCSTVGDYLRFSRMLLNGGTLDGKRLLRPDTVRLMTKDHVGKLNDEGFGLGVEVIRNAEESDGLDCVGSFGWSGAWYTIFFIDPEKKMIGICMAQLRPRGEATLRGEFKRLVYQAVMN